VCNKIGTYLKAVAARDCNVPFYAAFARTTFDAARPTGATIPIEERDPDEVRFCAGTPVSVSRSPETTPNSSRARLNTFGGASPQA
jgi:methylthioribose-1-phosphate isomerase